MARRSLTLGLVAGWLTICLAGALVAGAPAPAKAEGSALQQSFQRFCSQWMQKLQVRQRDNATNAQAKQHPQGVLYRYTGYASQPDRCEVQEAGKGRAVGKLVYSEYVMQKWGASLQAARSSRARIAATTEVMELFRFDGTRWRY